MEACFSSIDGAFAVWTGRGRSGWDRIAGPETPQARARRRVEIVGVLWLCAWLTAEILRRGSAERRGPRSARQRLRELSANAATHVLAWSLGWSWAAAMWTEGAPPRSRLS